MPMTSRLNLFAVAPEASKAVLALEQYCQNSGIPKRLIHLIKLRASIINGCAYCVDMHVKEARHDGLSEQWINLVSVWHEARVYSDAERAVLGWTDALTLLAQTRAPDADYDALRAHFSEEDIAKIIVIIGTINVWNRMAVGTRMHHPVDPGAKAA
jgi:AhpD family alkylhydroperoxidase